MEYIIANNLGLNGIMVEGLSKLKQKDNSMDYVFETPAEKEYWEKDFNSIYLEYLLPNKKCTITLEEAWEDTYMCKVLIKGQWRHCFLYDKYLILVWIDQVPWTEDDYKENPWANESEEMTKLVTKKIMFIVK